MPAHVIKPDLRPVTLGRLRDLKRVWGVSMQALCERSYSLGVLTAADRTRLYKAMNARGWRTSEPDGDLLAPEEPELVTAIGTALRAKGLSGREIAEQAGYAPDVDENPLVGPLRRLQAV
jgi:Zn-dependent peptidase ImmA (M78 family)